MNYIDWVLQTIREDELLDNWVEQLKNDVAPIIQTVLEQVNTGINVLVLTDEARRWFADYAIYTINAKSDRPLLPFIKMDMIIQNQHLFNSTESIALVKDMLSIAFPNGYIIWYIGISNTKQATFAKGKYNSFKWIMDEELPNSIYLYSKDSALDFKLLQLFRLFDKSLSGSLYGEFDLS